MPVIPYSNLPPHIMNQSAPNVLCRLLVGQGSHSIPKKKENNHLEKNMKQSTI